MAHEIKNPLTPIQLSAERIAKRLNADERGTVEAAPAGGLAVSGSVKSVDGPSSTGILNSEGTSKIIREGTDTILREVQSLKSMVDEFSRFARLPDAKLVPGDLNAVVTNVVSMYADRPGDIQVDAELSEKLPPVLMDEEHIKRVFVNLIENSVEAFDSDAPVKKITVSTRHDAARDLVVAEVSDNGKGIVPADFQRLFQPYFSTKGRGTGLGLAIAKEFIQAHGGAIQVESKPGVGSCFQISLPINRK
jgi:nitrogen fixation/metabolism regulation signal transduction histidine kinase